MKLPDPAGQPSPTLPMGEGDDASAAPIATEPARLAPDASEDAQPSRPLGAPRSPRARAWRALLIVAALLVVLFGVVSAALVRPLIARRVRSTFARRGVVLEQGDFELAPQRITIRNATLRLERVRGVSAQVDRITIELDGMKPHAIDFDGVSVLPEAPFVDLLSDVRAWHRAYWVRDDIAMTGQRIALRWGDRGNSPWLEVDNGSFGPAGNGFGLFADRVAVVGVPLGALVASTNATQSMILLRLARGRPAKPPVKIELQHGETLTAKVTLNAVSSADLVQLGAVELPGKSTVVDGTIEATMPLLPRRGAVDASVKVTLKGWVPPHPSELEGIVFGDKTTVEARVVVPADMKLSPLTDVSVVAGAFRLTGSGAIEQREDHSRLGLKLAGNIPCTALAGTVIGKKLGGGLIGTVVGGIAQQTLAGVVMVAVNVTGDSRNPAAAKVDTSARVACKLVLPLP